LVVVAIGAIPANAASILSATEAGFVDSETPDTNFFDFGGFLAVLSFSDRQQISYVKYDLSSISDSEVITSLKFNAFLLSSSQFFVPVTIDIFHVPDDSWFDENLTWNNRPSLGDFLGTLTIDPNVSEGPVGIRYQWDLSGYDYSGDVQDNFLSMALVVRNPSSAGLGFGIARLEITSAPADSDQDGVPDETDVCPGTVIPEAVPTVQLGVDRFALTNADGIFDTVAPKSKGPQKTFTIKDTAGCSCEQIIERLGLGQGHTKFGCGLAAMEQWIELVNP